MIGIEEFIFFTPFSIAFEELESAIIISLGRSVCEWTLEISS
jgi:hypothetical protein